MKESKIWDCKIGYANSLELPPGADRPMGKVIEKVFKKLTGHESKFCFSGWGGSLSETELAVVENRWPKHSRSLNEILERLSLLVEVVDESNKKAMKKIIKDLEAVIIVEKLHGN